MSKTTLQTIAVAAVATFLGQWLYAQYVKSSTSA